MWSQGKRFTKGREGCSWVNRLLGASLQSTCEADGAILFLMSAGRDASKIADEVITHLVGLIGSSVRVTLEIEAEIPSGAPESVVRVVTENSRTLKFDSQGFEKE